MFSAPELTPVDRRYGEPFERKKGHTAAGRSQPGKKASKCARELAFVRLVAGNHHPQLIALTQYDFERCCDRARRGDSIGDVIDFAYECLLSPSETPEDDPERPGRGGGKRKTQLVIVNPLVELERQQSMDLYRRKIQIRARIRNLKTERYQEDRVQNKLTAKIRQLTGPNGKPRPGYAELQKHYSAELGKCQVRICYVANELTDCQAALKTLEEEAP